MYIFPWSFVKDFCKALLLAAKVVYKPIASHFRDMFRGKTVIVGPRGSGKTTLRKILRGEGYFIGEYNHTSELVLIKDSQVVTYESGTVDGEEGDIKLKIRHDVPGEDLKLWKEVIKKDKPKGVILIVDLYGLVRDGGIDVSSVEEFVDFEAIDSSRDRIIFRSNPKQKFQQHIDSFKTIKEACLTQQLKLKSMIVFLNKFEKWGLDVDEIKVVKQYKEAVNERLNLTILAKSLGLTGDIQWAVTSLDETYHDKRLEPALRRFAKRLA